MKNVNNIILFVGFIATIYACTSDSIDLKPRAAISSELIFTNPDFAEAYLNEIYSGIPHGFNRGWYMLDAASDDAENSYHWPGSNTIFNSSNITPANSPFNSLWTNGYSQIRRLNEFIQNYKKLKGSSKFINRLKGEAHFLRGFYYSYFLRTFGGVPIIKVPQELNSEGILVSRNSKEEVLNFIVSEFDKASDYFKKGEIGTSTRGGWAATMAMKGRVLLHEGKYKLSAESSKEVIDKGKLILNLDYQNIFLDDKSSEVIFDVQFKDPDKTHWANLFNTPKSKSKISGGWGGTGPTQNIVDQYEMKATGLLPEDPKSGYDKNKPYEGRDPRFYASIIYDGTKWKGTTIEHRPGGDAGIASRGDFTRTGYSLKKFMQENRNHTNGSTQHWVFIRLAEVYLNYAEALIESNKDLNLAVDAINIVRKRAEMPPIATGSQSELRKKVRHERRIELAFEEHRFWDIRRWKIAGKPEVLTIYRVDMDEQGKLKGTGKVIWETRKWNDRDYLFPIPQSEIDKNPNLIQNHGY